jgi:hypothetical protein
MLSLPAAFVHAPGCYPELSPFDTFQLRKGRFFAALTLFLRSNTQRSYKIQLRTEKASL